MCIRDRFKNDICFLHTDFWAFPWFTKEIARPFSYCAFDSINYPEHLQNMIREYEQVVVFCKFTHDELKRYGVDSVVIPHGVETKIYKPLDKKECREKFNIDMDKFVIGKVSANADKENGCRKGWIYEFKALRQFLDNNPDVKNIVMFCHTNPEDPRGYPLKIAAHKEGLDDVVIFRDPRLAPIPVSDQELSEIYSMFDIFTMASMREGFGLTIAEAMSCGVPVVGHNFSSIPEVVGEGGWLVKSKGFIDTPILATTAYPDIDEIEKAYYDAYFNADLEKLGIKAREHIVKKYDIDKVYRTKWSPFLQSLEDELEDKPLRERKLI